MSHAAAEAGMDVIVWARIWFSAKFASSMVTLLLCATTALATHFLRIFPQISLTFRFSIYLILSNTIRRTSLSSLGLHHIHSSSIGILNLCFSRPFHIL